MASKCDQCKIRVPDQAKFCPRCGRGIRGGSMVFKVVMAIVIFVMLLLVGTFVIAMPRAQVLEQSINVPALQR